MAQSTSATASMSLATPGLRWGVTRTKHVKTQSSNSLVVEQMERQSDGMRREVRAAVTRNVSAGLDYKTPL
jgi:hypothetical protein